MKRYGNVLRLPLYHKPRTTANKLCELEPFYLLKVQIHLNSLIITGSGSSTLVSATGGFGVLRTFDLFIWCSILSGLV